MMKRNILAVVIPALLVAGAANAAEVYNKDGNKLDIYGKTVGLHYFSDSLLTMAIRLMLVLVSKGKLRLTPSCPVTVSGNTTLPVTTLKAAVTLRTATKPVWHLLV
ncbi:Outer membrane protein F [Citrobacter freundii]|nr:Outer membrane protein F [Citrobacter freundii]CAH5080546.1 Outer membrane protein F [Citrobacter freundii]